MKSIDPGSIWEVISEKIPGDEVYTGNFYAARVDLNVRRSERVRDIPKGERLQINKCEVVDGHIRIEFSWKGKEYWTFEKHFRRDCVPD